MESTNKKTIFIVDDDKFLLSMYTIKFKNAGFEVEFTNEASLAIDKLKAGYSPDVMLLDVVMPGLDGLELLAIVRKGALSPKTAYIILSNQSAVEDIERAKGLDVAGYIVKATTIPSEVVTEVSRILKDFKKA
jgi:CheY-like chemotaxis protein